MSTVTLVHQFSLMLFSVQPVLNGIIGGIGTVFGPVLGAILMTPLGEFLRSYLGTLHQGFNFFVYGLILIGVVMVAPQGIFPALVPFLKAKGWMRNRAKETDASSSSFHR